MSRCFGAGTEHYAADLNDNEFRFHPSDTGRKKRRPSSLSLDFRRANHAAVVVILFADMRREIGAAQSHGIETLAEELGLDIGCIHCGGEPTSELGDDFLGVFAGASTPYQMSAS